MTGNAKRWKNLAEELAAERDQAPRPPSVRSGRLARAKRRAQMEADGLDAAGTNPSETQKPGKPSGTPGKPPSPPITPS